MSYERWLQEIDTYLAMMVGVSHQDLPDQPYRDWYCEYMNLRICESAYRPFVHSPIRPFAYSERSVTNEPHQMAG